MFQTLYMIQFPFPIVPFLRMSHFQGREYFLRSVLLVQKITGRLMIGPFVVFLI